MRSPANGICVAEKTVMNISDFLIIYFACGAPVSVYFYFQNRRLYSKQLWLKTILNFTFWIPFFVQIILKSRILHDFSKTRPKTKNYFNAVANDQILAAQKKIENILSETDVKISIYEFREVCERFVGLTIAYANNKNEPFEHEKEIFRIAGSQIQEFSAQCLHRRNQKRLKFHQTQAEKDFLQMIAMILDSAAEPEQLSRLTDDFVAPLGNFRAQNALKEIFEAKLQRIKETHVKDLERNLWNPELRKQPAANPISMNLRVINKKARLSIKD